MAKFQTELPTEILRDFDFVRNNAAEIFGKMTRAGAEVVKSQIASNATRVFKAKTAAKLNHKLKITKTYDTPSDGGINTKVAYYGYIPRSDGKPFKIKGHTYQGVPAPLLAALREFGAKGGGGMPEEFKEYWTKKPFVRPAFDNKGAIEKAMLKTQKELSGGLLE